MNRKITPFLHKSLVTIGVIALLAMMVAPALAAENLYISNSELNYYTYTIAFTEAGDGRGRWFAGNDEYLSRVTFYLSNNSVSGSGTVTAKLYNATSHLPTNLVETSTTTYSVGDLAAWTLVDFTFASTTILLSTNEYCVTLEVVTFGTNFRLGLSNNGEGGVYSNDGGSTWAENYLQPIFYIYTDDEEGGGAPYTPPGTVDPTTWDELITDFTAFMVPLLVMLLPAFLLCFITRRVDKWLILIGLAVGAGLGYYFGMVPLWLVFLVTIGLIGMAYQSVRGGGAE